MRGGSGGGDPLGGKIEGSGVVEIGVQSKIPLCTIRAWILMGKWEDMEDSVSAREVARLPPR